MEGYAAHGPNQARRGYRHALGPQLGLPSASIRFCQTRQQPADMQKIERTTRRFNTLKVPRKLQASLPFASKTKQFSKQTKPTYMQSRAVVMDDEEKKAMALLQQVQALRKEKVAKRAEKKEEKRKEHRKEVAASQEKRSEKIRDERKEKLRQDGMKRKRDEAGAEGRFKKRK